MDDKGGGKWEGGNYVRMWSLGKEAYLIANPEGFETCEFKGEVVQSEPNAPHPNGWSEWFPIDENTPRDPNTEIMLYYKDWCGTKNMVVSGHWFAQEGREFEATWEHSIGYGDADMWQPLPVPPEDAK